MTEPNSTRLISVSEASKRLGVCGRTILYRIERRGLSSETIRIGRRRYFSPQTFEKLAYEG